MKHVRIGAAEPRRRAPHLSGLTVLFAAALGACSSNGTNPVDWWHDLEGGRIAEQRPPPPNTDAAYPNLGTVPARPVASDPAARGAIARGLVADRTNAQYAAGLNPLVAPAPAARPAQPAPRPADDNTSGATLDAAAAPARPVGPLGPPQPALPNVPVTPPRKAPTQSVQSSELPPPKAAEPAVPPTSKIAATTARPDARPAEPVAALPPVPDAPPPPPRLAGAPTVVAPSPPPATPPPPPPPVVVAAPGAPVLVAFPAGSATLPVESLGALKLLGRQVGSGRVTVTGFGDATGPAAEAQAAALPLALARARAIAANLLAAGVPSSAIRLNAEAQGRGGAARLN